MNIAVETETPRTSKQTLVVLISWQDECRAHTIMNQSTERKNLSTSWPRVASSGSCRPTICRQCRRPSDSQLRILFPPGKADVSWLNEESRLIFDSTCVTVSFRQLGHARGTGCVHTRAVRSTMLDSGMTKS